MTSCSKKHKTEVDTDTYFILVKGRGKKRNQEEKEKKRRIWEKKVSLPTKNKTKAAKGTEVENKVQLLQCWSDRAHCGVVTVVYTAEGAVCRVTLHSLPKEQIQSRCAFCSFPALWEWHTAHHCPCRHQAAASRTVEGSQRSCVLNRSPIFLPCQIRSSILQWLLLWMTWHRMRGKIVVLCTDRHWSQCDPAQAPKLPSQFSCLSLEAMKVKY